MSEVQEKIAQFLKSHGMYPGDIDMEALCKEFLSEMEAGLAGKESSLAMLPTYIETGKELPVNKPVVVMDAGGTNFRAAVVSFDEQGRAQIKNLRKKAMPGVEKEVSRKEFFDTLAAYIRDIAEVSKKIGFCFSYPCEITSEKDGKLIFFSKEIKAPEVVGQMIGKNLNAALKRAGLESDANIVILNDTVTTLLAGMAGLENKQYDSYVGFILGTGTNTCYIEQAGNIKKLKSPGAEKNMIINVESGNFGKVPQGDIDKQFSSSTDNPGRHKFEKMISGAYLGSLCLKVIKTALAEELFSSVAAEKLRQIEQLDTRAISDYLAEPVAASNAVGEALFNASNYDKAMMENLISSVVQRAAKLTAVNLSAAVLKGGKGRDKNKPVCIVAEGTTFYSLPGLKEGVKKYLQDFLVGQKKRYYEIVSVENATLIGAAIAGLTN